MADDDYDDDDLDTDQDTDQDDLDDADDEDADASDTSTDEGLCDALADLLSRKFHLDIPPDTDPKKFLRDLYAAAHGHPGIEAMGGPARMSSRVAKIKAERLSHRRRRKEAKARRLSAGGKPPARKKAVVAEVLANCGLAR